MKISLIVAASENNVIGKDNTLPWSQPADLKYFKNKTWGMPVLMGRKTFEAMGKALPGRLNIVITTNKDWKSEGAETAENIEAAIKKAEDANYKEAFITGGGEIFKQSMSIADTIFITRIHAQIQGDSFFPVINTSDWVLDNSTEVHADEKNQYDMSFQTWVRKDPNPLPYS